MQHWTSTDITQAFTQRFGQAPTLLVRACGRINLIGEHTDYNNGYVLPAAIDKHLYFAIAENGTTTCRFYAADIDQTGTADLQQLVPAAQLWLTYLRGIAQQFQAAGKALRGVDVAFGGNLPIGAGVSSSAALECGFAFALNTLFDGGYTRPELAELAQRSSQQFVGIPCGIMDQFASLMGKAGHFILLDCQRLVHRYIPADFGAYELVLLNTQVHHELASSAYGERVSECQAGVAYLQQHYPKVRSLRDVLPTMLELHREGLDPIVFRRCHYVINEHYRTLRACEHLQNGQIAALGQLLFDTHAGLRDDYEVSCPELDFLVDFASRTSGVVGARLMGGGFGGCTVNIVQREAVSRFVETAQGAYYQQFGKEPTQLQVQIADGTDTYTP